MLPKSAVKLHCLIGVRHHTHIPAVSDLREADVPQMTAAATAFLAGQSWCARIVSVVPIFALAGVIGVYRCSLIPSHPDADVMVWVVVGDVPPAYLVHEPGDSWQDALAAYVHEMRRWVSLAEAGNQAGDDVIPVNVAPTAANAQLLASRLDFIQARLVDADPASVERDV